MLRGFVFPPDFCAPIPAICVDVDTSTPSDEVFTASENLGYGPTTAHDPNQDSSFSGSTPDPVQAKLKETVPGNGFVTMNSVTRLLGDARAAAITFQNLERLFPQLPAEAENILLSVYNETHYGVVAVNGSPSDPLHFHVLSSVELPKFVRERLEEGLKPYKIEVEFMVDTTLQPLKA